ncbi:MAG: rod shape-determining protein MreC [Chlorobi bacterium]|nr:rod shape-determining protein MreC [Chlorobiota bacterium]
MAATLKPYSKRVFILYLVLLSLAVVLIYRTHFGVRYRTDLTLLEWTGRLNAVSARWSRLFSLPAENRRLLEENSRLWERVGAPGRWRLEGFSVRPASVVAGRFYGRNRYVIIDRGERDGVRVNDGVWTSRGIIGVVVRTSPRFARVDLLTHPEVSVSVRPSTAYEYGFTAPLGPESDLIKVTDLPSETPVGVGDSVITSGLSRIFPGGLPVGTVLETETNLNEEKILTVSPFVDPKRIRYVHVGRAEGREEIKRLAGEE